MNHIHQAWFFFVADRRSVGYQGTAVGASAALGCGTMGIAV